MKVTAKSASGGCYKLFGFSLVLLAAVGTSGCGLGGYATAETTGIVVGGTAGAVDRESPHPLDDD